MKIGILGGGQLGQMLGQAAATLGHECVFYDTGPDACAASAGKVFVGEFDDKELLQTFAAQCDVVTYEFENLPLECVAFVQQHVTVHPPLDALRVTQDRLLEKELCAQLSLQAANSVAIHQAEDLVAGIEQLGMPCLLKTTRLGYDGKGQVFIASEEDMSSAQQLDEKQTCILEQCIAFSSEVSQIATRSADGTIVYYPLTQNTHKEGILRVSRAPADVEPTTIKLAQDIAKSILEHFDYVGTLAIEFFLMADGTLLVNEMAPRVHNSGHWTIEGATTSQFANHIRAITGMPLGDTNATGSSAMVNVIGTHPDQAELESLEGVYVHYYGKAERPKRKLGHITIHHNSKDFVSETLQKIV